jgi:hypothetical protein
MTDLRQDDPVDRALENLGRVAVPVEESVRASRRRDRVVGVLGSTLGRVRARRTFARRAWVVLFSVMSVGAVAVGVGAYTKLHGPDAPVIVAEEQWQARGVFGNVLVRDAGGERKLASGDTLRIGDSIEALEGASVVLGLSSGDVKLRSGGRVELISTTAIERKLKIAVGTVDVDLPRKLPKGQALILETPDAQVRVVGTAFQVDVALDADGKPATEVSVRRGTVWVMQRGERRATLNAGSKWRSTPEARVTASTPTPAPVADARKVTASTAGERSARSAQAEGTLAEENRLYESALAARNAGDDRRAAEAFGQLLSRYPRSVLGEQSLAGRFRALDRAGQVSLAVAAARRYLAAYPEGFARADAERIVKR